MQRILPAGLNGTGQIQASLLRRRRYIFLGGYMSIQIEVDAGALLPKNTEQAAATTEKVISYDGSLSHITKLWLINVTLFFVTLSLYRFWGRTRIRQYVWSHITILGDRLEYTGTGKELFFRVFGSVANISRVRLPVRTFWR